MLQVIDLSIDRKSLREYEMRLEAQLGILRAAKLATTADWSMFHASKDGWNPIKAKRGSELLRDEERKVLAAINTLDQVLIHG